MSEPSDDEAAPVRPSVRHPLFARFIEWTSARDEERGLAGIRREALAGLSGRVIEVGAGTGPTFRHYPRTVEEVVAVEPEPYLRGRATEAARSVPIPIHVVDGTADRIPMEDASFDAAVVCGVLCSVADPAAALAELRRVLRPDGELRFYEHVRAEQAGFGRMQDAVDLVWPRLMGGCHPNRDTLAAIERAGYRIESVRRFRFPPSARLWPVAPRILGVARLAIR
jgi:ubiquinone/menaquinone biosynthesis C-methylase UbiE